MRAEKNLKALRDVLEQLPDSAHLTFVGDGPFRQELEEHFAGCRVTFTVRVRQGLGPRFRITKLSTNAVSSSRGCGRVGSGAQSGPVSMSQQAACTGGRPVRCAKLEQVHRQHMTCLDCLDWHWEQWKAAEPCQPRCADPKHSFL